LIEDKVVRAIERVERYARSESVEARRILDQDSVVKRRIGRPNGKLVQHTAVIDRRRQSEFTSAMPRNRAPWSRIASSVHSLSAPTRQV
jgi:hypothetical protein